MSLDLTTAAGEFEVKLINETGEKESRLSNSNQEQAVCCKEPTLFACSAGKKSATLANISPLWLIHFAIELDSEGHTTNVAFTRDVHFLWTEMKNSCSDAVWDTLC